MFLGKTLYSHNASLHPGVNGYWSANCQGNLMKCCEVSCDGLTSHSGVLLKAGSRPGGPRPAARSPWPTSRPVVHSMACGPAAHGPLYGPRPEAHFFWSAVYTSACLIVDPHRQRKMDTDDFPWSFRFLSKSFQSFAIHLILFSIC